MIMTLAQYISPHKIIIVHHNFHQFILGLIFFHLVAFNIAKIVKILVQINKLVLNVELNPMDFYKGLMLMVVHA